MGVYYSAGQKFRPIGIESCLNSWLWPNILHYGLFVLRNSATPLEIYCENALFQAVWHKNVCHVKKCRSPLLGMLKETQWGATRLSPEYIRQSILSFFCLRWRHIVLDSLTWQTTLTWHSVFSSYLLTKHISSAIMGWLLSFNPKWKDFAMGNFFYWANIAHRLYLSTSNGCETNFTK